MMGRDTGEGRRVGLCPRGRRSEEQHTGGEADGRADAGSRAPAEGRRCSTSRVAAIAVTPPQRRRPLPRTLPIPTPHLTSW